MDLNRGSMMSTFGVLLVLASLGMTVYAYPSQVGRFPVMGWNRWGASLSNCCPAVPLPALLCSCSSLVCFASGSPFPYAGSLSWCTGEQGSLESVQKALCCESGGPFFLISPRRCCAEDLCGAFDLCNETLVKSIADAMSTNGMKEMGYDYITLDVSGYNLTADKKLKGYRR